MEEMRIGEKTIIILKRAEKGPVFYWGTDEFHFDISIANKHIGFIEKFCKVPSGGSLFCGSILRFELEP